MILTPDQIRERSQDEAEHHVITKVTDGETAYGCSAGLLGWGLDKEYGVEPKEGDTVTLYGGGFGSSITGIDLNGVPVFYKTKAERDAEHKRWVEDLKIRRMKEFEENRDKLDKAYDEMPELFRVRLDRFRKADPNFRWEGEAYESFILVEAAKIADHFKDADKVMEWRRMSDYKAQIEMAPFISDQHSGNTFGAAGAFAEALLRGREV